MIRDAVFSQGHVHRWRLSRSWAPEKGTACWIGANPSVAGKDYDDPTCTRIISFTESFGYGRMILVNISPFISTDPRKLPHHDHDLMFPEAGEKYVVGAIAESQIVIAAWGVLDGCMRKWADALVGQLQCYPAIANKPLWCLGKTKDGSPRHPLYVHSKTKLERWK
jgi:hypothetical protein